MNRSQEFIGQRNLSIGWRETSKNRKGKVGDTGIFFNSRNDQFNLHDRNPNRLRKEMSKPLYDVIPAKARLGEAWAGIQKLLRPGVETLLAPQEQFFV